MKYYISDLHFGHANAIKFDDRPFSSVEEMNETLVSNWNERVQDNDDIYIVGDVCYKCKQPDQIIKQLKGIKHLILGNHDYKMPKYALSLFESVDDALLIKDKYQGEEIKIHLCHYPMVEWWGYFHGAWHIYGHIHASTNKAYEIMKGEEKALNAGCMINNYVPVLFSELVINNQNFKVKH